MTLSDRDLETLAIIAAELSDDRALPMSARETWGDRSARLLAGEATRADLVAVADATVTDAALQRDAKVRARYLDLAERARAAK